MIELLLFLFRSGNSTSCWADFYVKEGKCIRGYNLNNAVYTMSRTYILSNRILFINLKHVKMDITDQTAFIHVPILVLVDGVWKENASVQKKTATQKSDVEVVSNSRLETRLSILYIHL